MSMHARVSVHSYLAASEVRQDVVVALPPLSPTTPTPLRVLGYVAHQEFAVSFSSYGSASGLLVCESMCVREGERARERERGERERRVRG